MFFKLISYFLRKYTFLFSKKQMKETLYYNTKQLFNKNFLLKTLN